MANKKVLAKQNPEHHVLTTTPPVQLDAFVHTDLSTPASPISFLWSFARSICKANTIASLKERDCCEDGVPCVKLHECTQQAEKTVRYIENRKSAQDSKALFRREPTPHPGVNHRPRRIVSTER